MARRPATTAPVLRRSIALLVVCTLLAAAVVGRLVLVQVIDAEHYRTVAAEQRTVTVELPASRGLLLDRNNQVLATSLDAASVYADPRAFRPAIGPDGAPVPPRASVEEVAERLAPVLNRDAAELVRLLTGDGHFVYLARQLDYRAGEAVAAMDIAGIGVLTEPTRVYPAGQLAAQLLGVVNIDGQGLAGLEASLDEELTGRPGSVRLEQSPQGVPIAAAAREVTPAAPGRDVVLTIDRVIQHAAEAEVARTAARTGAASVTATVLEVGTGDILAMASWPGYDANEPGSADPSAMRARAVTDVFEPGSIQKALTLAGALEAGAVTAAEAIQVPQAISVGGRLFTEEHGGGETLDVAQILERSSNVGAIMMAQRLGPAGLEQSLRDFGLGAPTGAGFPGEVAGLLSPNTDWSGTSLPTIAIGYGAAVTQLQMAAAYATIANGGLAVTPRFVRGYAQPDGGLELVEPLPPRVVVSPETAAAVTAGLRAVIDGERGTGAAAAVEGYDVAGKTGTARRPDGAGGYDGHTSSFVGFAPAANPRVVVAVTVDRPTQGYYAAEVAAPAFAALTAAALDALRVPPTAPVVATPEPPAPAAAADAPTPAPLDAAAPPAVRDP